MKFKKSALQMNIMAAPSTQSAAGMDQKSLLRGSPDALLIVEGTRVLEANDRALALFSGAPGPLVGLTLEALFPGGLALEEDCPYSVVPALDQGGKATRSVEVCTRELVEGPRRLLVVSARDASTRVGDLGNLERMEKRFNEAQKVAHIGSWSWDIPEDKVTWTDELYRLYGLEPQSEYIDYQRYLQLIHPEDREAADGVVQEAFKSLSTFDFQHRLMMSNGGTRWLRGRGEVFTDGSGAPVRMVGTAQDITEQKAAEKIVEDALHEKEVLLKEVHHRVKNNLQIVSSLLRIQGRKTGDEASQVVLAQSRSRIRSMALVHEKLYRSRDFASLDASEYLGDLLAELRLSLSVPHGIKVELAVQPFRLDLDRAITFGLLTNELVTNAFKHAFTQPSGHVIVRGGLDPTGATFLEVEDDGVGLPEPFDPTEAETLGMRLVHTLVDQLGGSLSWGPGQSGTSKDRKGSRFLIRVEQQ